MTEHLESQLKYDFLKLKTYLRFTNNAVFRVPVTQLGSGTRAIIRYPATLDTRRSLSIHDTISLQKNISVSVVPHRPMYKSYVVYLCIS